MLNSFDAPKIEVVFFNESDIITTSGVNKTTESSDGGIKLPDDNW